MYKQELGRMYLINKNNVYNWLAKNDIIINQWFVPKKSLKHKNSILKFQFNDKDAAAENQMLIYTSMKMSNNTASKYGRKLINSMLPLNETA